jgi:hypothetical protein
MKRLLAVFTIAGGAAFSVAGGAGAVAATVASPTVGGPMIRASETAASASSSAPTISLNWSGYAATSSKKFNYVHSEFVQPAVTCPGKPKQFTSNWVGLDGFNDETVEQDGTYGYCGGPDHTTPQYAAWYEMYPAGSVNVFRVRPGDVIDATVQYTAGKFVLTIADLSTGKSATTSAACASCERASAEWIVERPAGCSASGCFLFALADFGTTTMSEDIAGAGSGSAKGISSFTNYPIFMVGPLKKGYITLDTVGGVDSSTDSFTATWDRSGKPTPITLGPSR